MNVQRNITMPDASTLDKMPYRTAIDRVLGLRAVVMQVALNASQLATTSSDADQQVLFDALQKQAQSLSHMLDVLKGKETFEDLPEELSVWLVQMVASQDTHLRLIARMSELTNELVAVAKTDDGVPQDTLQTYIRLGQGDFFEAITKLTDYIWVDIEAGRSRQLDVAMQSATRLGEGLARLERIGKYVRSMSINASVEASRAGESGKGLAIIAQEFKTLAEEVQQLTLSAREDIESIEASQ